MIMDTNSIAYFQGLRKYKKYVACLTACCILLLIVPFFGAGCTPSIKVDPDAQFLSLIGAGTDPQFRLFTSKHQYKLSDELDYVPANKTGKAITFQDQSYGIQMYKYDSNANSWIQLPVPVKEADPHPVTMPPFDVPNTIFSNKMIPGKIRLVVIGWTDPTNPDGSKLAAYTDIQVEPGN
jgi:hypothetical protein